MSFINYFREECVQVGSSATNKAEVLAEIAALAKKCSELDSIAEEQILKLLKEREALGSTGFENGIAIPHCRIKGLESFVVGLLSVPDGIDFEAIDKKPSTLIFFIIGPDTMQKTHIQILSSISRIVSDKQVKEELLSMANPSALRESFLRQVCDISSGDKADQTCLFVIHVQKREALTDVLEVLSSLSASASVIKGENAGDYLNTLPLFSSFWNEKEKGFCRLVVGAINRKLVNELMRNINLILNDLEGDQAGLMITIHECLVTAGSIET